MRHDIFISYRRDSGEHLAARVKDALKSRDLSVFMDVEDLKSGKFDESLFKKIEEAMDISQSLEKTRAGKGLSALANSS